MKLSIDRFEGNFAVCEDDNRKLHMIEVSLLSHGAKPGDIIDVSSDGTLSIDVDETIFRREKIKKLQEKLFK